MTMKWTRLYMFLGKSGLCILSLVIFLLQVSCTDESLVNEPEDGYMLITGITTRSYNGAFPGDGIDGKIETLRILAFDKQTTMCESNVFYSGSVLEGESLRHPMKKGEYDFIFLVNEPSASNMKRALENIGSKGAVNSMSYPAAVFNTTDCIPMIAEANNVKVLVGGNIEVDGNATTVLAVNLRRLAARVDVLLKATSDFGDVASGAFKGVTFSNMPDKVPLVHALPSDPISGSWVYADPVLPYLGTSVARGGIRRIEADDESIEINSAFLTAGDRENGMVWAAKVKRVILPSSFFSDETDEDKAIDFTVHFVDKYSPSCKLKILSDPDYTLPANARLELIARIQEPLEVNIIPSPWSLDGGDWEIPDVRRLNVSHTSAKITDMNGVRVSFWSNMPVVKVLETVQDAVGNEYSTNEVFNSVVKDENYLGSEMPYRFYYDPATGNGYMDLLVDGTNTVSGSPHDRTKNMSGTYTLTLSAEEEDGGNALQRTLTVAVTQEGLRFIHNPTANAHGLFNAAFFAHNQRGERIITGQHAVNLPWSVDVPAIYRDWLVVSATPSFDPGVGTESPGDAEHYPVRPNLYKGENGYSINGLKGRIYFRIGVKESAAFVPNEQAAPKFGYVNLKYRPTGSTWETTMRIYVRQGEAAEYIYSPTDPIPDIVYNAWNGTTDISSHVREDMRLLSSNSRRGAVKFSPYNLTTDALAGSTNPASEKVDVRGGRFVDFPSQAGALFQWAIDLNGGTSLESYYRLGYNPSRSSSLTGTPPWNYGEFKTMWDGAEGIPAYKNQFEICPSGYRRPNDGHTSQIAYNGYYDYLPTLNSSGSDFTNYKNEIEYSELRVSLFNVPFAGNAASSADYKTVFDGTISTNTGPGTYPYGTGGVARKQLKGTTFTFYSDGFFDRRPVKDVGGGNYGVLLNSSRVAYQGVLYFNPETHASVFFPATGRLNNIGGTLESRGSTGYYWSSSVGPQYYRNELIAQIGNNRYDRRVRYGSWSFEAAYNSQNFRIAYQGFAQAIRCVREETVSN